MPLTDSIPTIVAQAVLEALQKRLVYSRMFNQDYQGEVTPGNTVKIVSPGASVNIGDYTKETDINWQFVSDASQDMPINQQKYFAIAIDDIDAIQARPDMLAAYARDAVYQLEDTIDQHLVTTLAGASGLITSGLGTTTTPLEINSGNIGSTLRLIARKLDDAKVPREGRVISVPPWAVEDLVAANIADSTDNVSELTNGMVGRYAGFEILMSHNVPNTTNAKYKIVAGSRMSATMAMQINQTERIRLQNVFGDGIRGLAVYGAKVTRPGAIALSFWNEAAEA